MPHNKIALASLLLIFSLFATGCSLKLGGSTKAPSLSEAQPIAEEEELPEKSDSNNITASLKSLFDSGKSQKCAWENKTDEGKISGVIYFKGDKFYQETTLADGKRMYAISDGANMYSYFDGTNTGFKVAMDFGAIKDTAENLSGETKDMAPDFEKNMDFKCAAWAVDESKFTPPANITFTDLSGMLQNLDGLLKDVDVSKLMGK